MTFTAVVVSHGFVTGLRHMLCNLINQSRKPDEILAYVSGTLGVDSLGEDFPEVTFTETLTYNDWGHRNRQQGLEDARSDYIGWFNDDDLYSSDYVKHMLLTAQQFGADAVYCNWSGIQDCHFGLGSSTAGNFIVKTELARKVGYPLVHRYEADGDFINSINDATDRVVKTHELLYTHNALARRGA